MDIVGWILWGVLAVFVLGQWAAKIRHPDGTIRILAGRSALGLTALLAATAGPGISRLHILWAAPALYVGSLIVTGKLNERDAARTTGPTRR